MGDVTEVLALHCPYSRIFRTVKESLKTPGRARLIGLKIDNIIAEG